MKLTEFEIKEIETALATANTNKIQTLKVKYNIGGCSCKAAAKLQQFLDKHR